MASGGKAPAAPDPRMILDLQNKYNRTNTQGPFGSSHWVTDDNGHETLVQTPSSQMQGSIDRAFNLSATPSQQLTIAPGLNQLAEAMLGKVGAQYGLGSANPNNPTIGFGMQNSGAPTHGAGGAFNTNLKGQQQSPPQLQNVHSGPMPPQMMAGG